MDGVVGNMHAWFTDYLSGRFVRVILADVASEWVPVTFKIS